MSNDRADVKKQVAGSLKEAIGKITGDNEVQAEGIAEKEAAQTRQKKSAKKGQDS